jgi:hypothetical protein
MERNQTGMSFPTQVRGDFVSDDVTGEPGPLPVCACSLRGLYRSREDSDPLDTN